MPYDFYNSLGFLSGKLSRLSSQMLERRFKHHNVTISIEQWRILAMLAESDNVSISTIAEALFLSLAPVSRQIKSLIDLQLVVTQQAEHDRKQKLICLTPRGRTMALYCRKLGYEVIQAMLGDLSESERESLIHLLRRCVAHAEQDDHPVRDSKKLAGNREPSA